MLYYRGMRIYYLRVYVSRRKREMDMAPATVGLSAGFGVWKHDA